MFPAGPTRADLSDLPEKPDRAGASRRTLLRVGAQAAWAAPVVALASEAPALAASSSATFAVTTAQFYLDQSAGDGRVVPLIVVTNSSPYSNAVTISFTFPAADFVGYNLNASGWAFPIGVNPKSLGANWSTAYVAGAAGSTPVSQLRLGAISKGSTSIANPNTTTRTRFAWAFARVSQAVSGYPSQTTPTPYAVAFTATDANNLTVSGVMTQIPAP